MARRATSLGPKPSLFVFFVCFLFLFSFFFFASFPFFVFNRKKPVFPPKKGIFWFIFSVSLYFSLNLFWPPPFSLFFSVSLFCSCLSFFLLVFLFWLSFSFLFLSLFFCSIFCAFVSWKEQHENIKLEFLFFIKMFSFLGFLSCFLFEISFPYLCFFSWFWVMFFVQHHCFWFQKTQVEKHIFSKKGGLQHNVFFYEPVFCKMWKVIVFFFWQFFWQFFGCFSKNTIQIGILAHFSKQKITKKMAFLEVIIWSKLEVIIWSKLTAS